MNLLDTVFSALLIGSMETLGLSSPQQREDNFQRLFWPIVHNSDDADLIGRRGFWVAFAAGMLSAIVLGVSGHPLLGC